LKPNISTIVGLLYGPKDARRDSGFALYYMGINIGSFLGQTVCGFLAQDASFKDTLGAIGMSPAASWHWGFGAAAAGMFLGLIVLVWRGKLMGEAGLHPFPAADAADLRRRQKTLRLLIGGVLLLFLGGLGVYWSGASIAAKTVNIGFGLLLVALTLISFGRIIFSSRFNADERKRLTVVFILFLASVLFWGAFEQAGSSLNLFAYEKSQLSIFGWSFPSSWYQNINSFGVILLSPLFAYIWLRAGERAPSSPAKFALGLVLVGLGCLVAALGSRAFDLSGERISPAWLTTVYLFHTIGELCLSPIGLSMVTKLAPQSSVSQVMSIWFLANAEGNFLAGQSVVLSERFTYTQIYWAIAAVTILAGVVLAIMVRPIKKMMCGVD
jgi:POT family proton-dependent oligopeptide transporter